MRVRKRKSIAIPMLIAAGAFILLIATAFLIPGIRERILWRMNDWRVRIDYALNPPEQAVFVPIDTPQATPLPTFTPLPSPTSTPQSSGETPEVIIPSPSPTALPASFSLEGIRYQDQHGLWNYCAPANLAMQLSFWGWEGNRLDTGAVLKPFEKDKNVMLYEMADYVHRYTNLQALVRSGGSVELMKALIANGFPVLVEKGLFIRDTSGKMSWMGHYAVMNGYDDAKSQFITQDSYYTANYPLSYTELVTQWRTFNYAFIVVFPPERQDQVVQILGDMVDEHQANQLAYQKANQEISENSGSELFYAWFNRGTSMVQLQDYTGAALAYDQAFQLYSQIPENERPWRIMWYQTGPYFAYYYSGRYQDVINLATLTINAASEPYLEESFYWRALAYVATGDSGSAISDLNTSVEYHPGFAPSVALMQQLGLTQ